MSSDLHRFISDNCVRLFGLADRSIIDFVQASASTSKTPDALFSSLTASGLPNTPDAHVFINELFSRVPRKSKHKSSADSTRKQAEKEAKALNARRGSARRSARRTEKAGRRSVNDISGKESTIAESGRAMRKRNIGSDGNQMMSKLMRMRRQWTSQKMRMKEKNETGYRT
ncbi:hypothetical protein BD769DRAFT_1519270 [Suillus cothurnatus]|nr:hypothetical protein BD769DRAFT_1519270 [Suillus cothurnatus]